MLLGQTLCESSLLMHTMSEGTQEAAGSREPGESKVSLHAAPCLQAEGCWGSACGGEGRWGHAGAAQPPRAGPLCSAPWPEGRGWAVAACWHRWACTAPSPPRPPALPLSWHGRHRAAPGGTWPCKALTAVTLSSPACVLCGRVHADLGIIGNKYVMKGIYFHTFCVVRSLTVPASFLQAMAYAFLS